MKKYIIDVMSALCKGTLLEDLAPRPMPRFIMNYLMESRCGQRGDGGSRRTAIPVSGSAGAYDDGCCRIKILGRILKYYWPGSAVHQCGAKVLSLLLYSALSGERMSHCACAVGFAYPGVLTEAGWWKFAEAAALSAEGTLLMVGIQVSVPLCGAL